MARGGAQQAVALLAHYGFHLRVAFEALRHRAHRVARAASGAIVARRVGGVRAVYELIAAGEIRIAKDRRSTLILVSSLRETVLRRAVDAMSEFSGIARL